ncbi:hypothetical protein J437_LFUL017956 [Ladona fulva]|uniref:Carboxylesterase type B domain-containing protein n=1 Tax=Ladona fulva TaxID=123851 RepID=A0A8K0P8F7_LADFU|nr:hypothetical protein J437_LFUL017956 [Ladona fulva]
MRAPGIERRPPTSDAAFFLLILLLPLPLPLPSAARALSPSSLPPPQALKRPQTTTRPSSPRVVQTQQGSLRGILLDFKARSQQGGTPQLEPVEAFWGVRYASPPVGELRFAPPKPPDKWEGVKEADGFAPVCPQVITLHSVHYKCLRILTKIGMGRLQPFLRFFAARRLFENEFQFINLVESR